MSGAVRKILQLGCGKGLLKLKKTAVLKAYVRAKV
jgi:hypothetical protein